MFGFDCATVPRLCRPDPFLVTGAGELSLLLVLGMAAGWRSGGSSAGARLWLERLVLAILALRLAANWAYEQGNLWWFYLLLLPLAYAVLAFAVALPVSLGFAITATVREGVQVWRRLGRMVVILALIPALHLLISYSGIWPTRISDEHMTGLFHRYRPVFDRIAAKYEAALPPDCQPVCLDGRRAPVPFDPELLLLHAWLGTDAGYWRYDGSLYLNWWTTGILEGFHTGYVYSPHHVPVPWRVFYRPLGGGWYLASGDV